MGVSGVKLLNREEFELAQRPLSYVSVVDTLPIKLLDNTIMSLEYSLVIIIDWAKRFFLPTATKVENQGRLTSHLFTVVADLCVSFDILIFQTFQC